MSRKNEITEDIKRYGKLVEAYGLIASHSGNISVRDGDYIYVTKTGTMLGSLTDNDIVKTSLVSEDENLKFASMETIVHKSIYKNDKIKAVIHSHPVYATSLSFVLDEIVPIDSEGKYILHSIPVLKAKKTIASDEVAQRIDIFFKKYKAVIVKGHGVFAAAENMEKAFYYSSVLENSSKIYYLTKSWISKI